MGIKSNVEFSGRLVYINELNVDNRAEIHINKFYQGSITLYKVSRDIVNLVREEIDQYLVIELEEGEKITAVGLNFKSASGGMNNCFKLELQADVLFKGERAYTNISKFQEIHYEITEGNELIVDNRAEIHINKFYQGSITLYKVSRDIVNLVREEIDQYLVIELEEGEKITAVGLNFKSASGGMNNCFKLELQADVLFKGERAYTNISKFQEIHYEITEGNELIGLCPYDVNKNYEDILFYRKIDIPINVENKIVKLENGELTFCVYPKYQYSKEAFSIGFAHHIIWKFDCAIDMEQIRKNLYIITDFFSVLAGESITVNSLNCVENDKLVEVIGICNFPKEKLNILKNDTIDYTSFKRGGLYKITDFQNLEQAMKYWFSNYKKIYNAQQAYGRILLDEDVKIVTINKFLAAMQLIEGYTQAYTDEEKEIKKFEEKKNEIISKLESEEEKELVGKGLGYSGISFRKAVKDYLYKGCNCFTDLSRTKFMKEKEKLINDIVNDRNFYTHSSNRVSATMEFDDLLNVASLCKELYRIISLKDMGLDTEIIKQRSQTNRMCYWLMKSIMKIEIENDTLQLGEFDSAMRYFSDSK